MTYNSATDSPAPAGVSVGYRWFQVLLGAICMLVPGTLLYGWTAFVSPIHAANPQWSMSEIQWAFTIFVATEAWLMWVEGPLVDRYGPRPAMIVAGILVVLGGIFNSTAESLSMLYLAAFFSGLGSGIVTCATISNAAKWFPDRHRGFAAGITVTGFALGAVITILPMVDFIATNGYRSAFLWFGGVMGVGLIFVALFMRAPLEGEVSASTAFVARKSGKHDYKPLEMVRSSPFWILFTMFTCVGIGGLIITAQLGPITKAYGIADTVMFGIAGLTGFKLALMVDRVCNVFSRPLFGYISDRLGREKTMALAFALEALGIYLLLHSTHSPLLFALLSGAVFLAFGEIYALMPATLADIYGEKHAAANYGVLYIAKGVAALWVPIASTIVAYTETWTTVFYIAVFADILAAVLALYLIRARRVIG